MNKVSRFTTPSGDEMVVLPVGDYQTLVDAAEMADDVATYDEIKRKLASGEEELIPAEYVDRMLAGENRVMVWREFRGLSGSELSDKAGISQAYLSQIESGKRSGTVATLKKIAIALGLAVDDLV
jgi:DNA-binding Xre family transcriptional regulator